MVYLPQYERPLAHQGRDTSNATNRTFSYREGERREAFSSSHVLVVQLFLLLVGC